jgi:TRAP-type uncharacterized transport system fused permease subunit
MSDVQTTYIGTRYTIMVALLTIAFVFSPTVLMLSHPFGYVAPSFAIACSALCLALAWINWKRHSELTMPSIVARLPRSR